ncbi:uncharacterized protein [Rutidosis leptorrhynchoides]|uniref:uncharacterized protein isoform X2 n=1 Tax=Rutidosis leptorrhynchoides TaxID=125765 RepID=UPI003A9A35AF
MEDLSIYESRTNHVSVRDKPKVVGVAKGKMKVSGRKTLADISNVLPRSTALGQYYKTQPSSDAINKVTEKLQTEIAALKKVLSEKDKIIELGGAEVQKLRVNLQKVKQQNQQLAQSNHQILAELNSFKETQKALKHELGCKNAVIIAKNLELEEIAKTTMCQANASKTEKVAETEETEVSTTEGDDKKDYDASIRQKSNSLDPSARKIQDNDTSNTGRLQTRRQTARFKLDEPKPTKDHLEIDHVGDSLPYHPEDDKVKVNDSSSVPLSSNEEDKKGLSARKIQDNDTNSTRRLHTRRQSARFELDKPKPVADHLKIDHAGDSLPFQPEDDKVKVNDSSPVPLPSKSNSSEEDKEGDSFHDQKPQDVKKASLSRPVREAAKKVKTYKEISVNVKMRRE